jgi:hypothetical protein
VPSDPPRGALPDARASAAQPTTPARSARAQPSAQGDGASPPGPLPLGFDCDPNTGAPCEPPSVCAVFDRPGGARVAYCTSDE